MGFCEIRGFCVVCLFSRLSLLLDSFVLCILDTHTHTLANLALIWPRSYNQSVIFLQILYTGDYSRREDRHLMSAELPEVRFPLGVLSPGFVFLRFEFLLFFSFADVSLRVGRFPLLVYQLICLLFAFYWLLLHPSHHYDYPIR